MISLMVEKQLWKSCRVWRDCFRSEISRRRDRHRDIEELAVPADADDLLLDLSIAADQLEDAFLLPAAFGSKKHLEVLAQNFRARVTQHVGCGGIPIGDLAVERLADKGVAREFPDPGELADHFTEMRIAAELGKSARLSRFFGDGRQVAA
jgi:hypothetical protein